jgi:hypothetical protein
VAALDLGADGELLADRKLDKGLLPLAAEAGPKPAEQGDRQRAQDHHGGALMILDASGAKVALGLARLGACAR